MVSGNYIAKGELIMMGDVQTQSADRHRHQAHRYHFLFAVQCFLLC